jgi:hypothetical protein
MIIGRGRPEALGENLLQCHSIHHKSDRTTLRLNPGLHVEKPYIDRLSSGTPITVYRSLYLKPDRHRVSSKYVQT